MRLTAYTFSLLFIVTELSAYMQLGDFNGDGRSDLLFEQTNGTMRCSLTPSDDSERVFTELDVSQLALDWHLAAQADLNGDGRTDLLFRHTNKTWAFVPMDGCNPILTQLALSSNIADTTWRVVGVTDFDGNERDELILRDENGAWSILFMSGVEIEQRVVAPTNLPVDTQWHDVGVGDFTGDGKSDILLRHRYGVWRLFSPTNQEAVEFSALEPFFDIASDWREAAIGDFDGDGKEDVLLRHATGKWKVQTLANRFGYAIIDWQPTQVASDWAWRGQAVGDMDGDGADELILHQRESSTWQFARFSNDDANTERVVIEASGMTDWRLPFAPVYIPDAVLRTILHTHLGLSDEAWLFQNRLANLFTLNAPRTIQDDAQVTGVHGLRYALALTSIDLSGHEISSITELIGLPMRNLNFEGNRIRNISPLASLTQLEHLSLSGNGRISEIYSLSELTNLKTMRFSDNEIGDISSIAKMTGLEVLDLSSNQISDLSPLSYQSKLRTLDLGSNVIEDISPLANLSSLIELDLSSNQIVDISPLSFLTNLVKLILDANFIEELQALSTLTKLTDLSLSENRIQTVSVLAELTGLAILNLSNNDISDISGFSNLQNLRNIDLSSNSISSIEPLVNLPNLVRLNLEGNALDEVSTTKVLRLLKENGVSIIFSYQGKFTDSRGRSAHWVYDTEVANDVANGIHVYFHGNTSSSAYGALYDFWWPEVKRIARDQGLVAVIIASPEAGGSTRPYHMPHQDGDSVRWWNYSNDVDLVHEMLQSDFGGTLKVDRNRVFLHGSSQGACFLNEFFKRWGSHYRGGMLLDCGCIDGGNDPLSHVNLYNGHDFRVFVRAAVGDFLHGHSKQAYGYYKYTTQFDTRGDLTHSGGHCAHTDITDDLAMDWLVSGKGLPNNPDNEAHLLRISQFDRIVGLATDQYGALWVIQQEETGHAPVASLWRSVDRGNSFELINRMPFTVYDFDIASEAHFYTTVEGNIQRSFDQGSTFEVLQVENVDAVGLSLSVADPSSVVVGWPRSDQQSLLISTPSGKLLLRRAEHGLVNSILVSKDYGETWDYRRIPEHGTFASLFPDPIQLDDDHWYLTLSFEWIAANSDLFWHEVTPVQDGGMYAESTTWDGQQLIGVLGDKVFSSSDLGASWVERNTPDHYRGNIFPTLHPLDYGDVLQLGGGDDGFIYNSTTDNWQYVFGSGAANGRGFSSVNMRNFKVAIDRMSGEVYVTDSFGVFRLRLPNRSDRVGSPTIGDRDGDNIPDFIDAFPDERTEYLDSDRDGIGNREDPDDDGDGIPDSEDMVPLDPDEYLDFDQDGIGDRSDHDVDGDGITDLVDWFRENSLEYEDSDRDGIGDWADQDDDNDGVLDKEDAFPRYAHEIRDTDDDFIGDNIDPSPHDSTISSPDHLSPVTFIKPREYRYVDLNLQASPNVVYPEVNNGSMMYGELTLGDDPGALPLAMLLVLFDQTNDQLFYLDRNRDGDLSNDGPPMRLKGGSSAANWFEMWVEVSYSDGVTLPYRFNLDDEFRAVNDRVRLFRAARGTQLHIPSIGETHLVVVDANVNALFNDPEDYFCVDLNQNLHFEGCGDPGSEHFRVGQQISANGSTFDLKISPSGYSIELNQIEASLVSQSAEKSDKILWETQHEHDNDEQLQKERFQGIEQYLVLPTTENPSAYR